jgi:hypothetical protein
MHDKGYLEYMILQEENDSPDDIQDCETASLQRAPTHTFAITATDAFAISSFEMCRNSSQVMEWARVKRWIAFFKDTHIYRCKAAAQVAGLQVIDCITGEIMSLPSADAAFATLSYVV